LAQAPPAAVLCVPAMLAPPPTSTLLETVAQWVKTHATLPALAAAFGTTLVAFPGSTFGKWLLNLPAAFSAHRRNRQLLSHFAGSYYLVSEPVVLKLTPEPRLTKLKVSNGFFSSKVEQLHIAPSRVMYKGTPSATDHRMSVAMKGDDGTLKLLHLTEFKECGKHGAKIAIGLMCGINEDDDPFQRACLVMPRPFKAEVMDTLLKQLRTEVLTKQIRQATLDAAAALDEPPTDDLRGFKYPWGDVVKMPPVPGRPNVLKRLRAFLIGRKRP
jgi:hypothetical protein